MILVWLLRKLEFAEEARPMDNREILAVPLISTEKNLFCHHYHLPSESTSSSLSFILNIGYCHYYCHLIELLVRLNLIHGAPFTLGLNIKPLKPFCTRSVHWLIIRPVLRAVGWILWFSTLEQGNSCLCTPEQRE